MTENKTKYSGLVCRGSYALGTACGKCARCKDLIPCGVTKEIPEQQNTYRKTIEPKEIYEKAIIKWGVDLQIDLLIEEMAELTVTLQHMKRGRIHNIPEEFADVEIVMEQLRPFFNKGDAIDTQKDLKIERLAERVKII